METVLCEVCGEGNAALFCKHLMAYVCASCHALVPTQLHYSSTIPERTSPKSPGALGPETGRGPQVSMEAGF